MISKQLYLFSPSTWEVSQTKRMFDFVSCSESLIILHSAMRWTGGRTPSKLTYLLKHNFSTFGGNMRHMYVKDELVQGLEF